MAEDGGKSAGRENRPGNSPTLGGVGLRKHFKLQSTPVTFPSLPLLVSFSTRLSSTPRSRVQILVIVTLYSIEMDSRDHVQSCP